MMAARYILYILLCALAVFIKPRLKRVQLDSLDARDA